MTDLELVVAVIVLATVTAYAVIVWWYGRHPAPPADTFTEWDDPEWERVWRA